MEYPQAFGDNKVFVVNGGPIPVSRAFTGLMTVATFQFDKGALFTPESLGTCVRALRIQSDERVFTEVQCALNLVPAYSHDDTLFALELPQETVSYFVDVSSLVGSFTSITFGSLQDHLRQGLTLSNVTVLIHWGSFI